VAGMKWRNGEWEKRRKKEIDNFLCALCANFVLFAVKGFQKSLVINAS
jgi:hypothetical protein